MPVEITFEITGEAQYARAFEILEHEARDLSDPLGEIGEDLRQRVGEQFGSEGSAGGSPWSQLDPEYLRWKELDFPGRPLLVRTGAMRGAALSPDAVRVSAHRMLYEVDSDYAMYHQTGTDDMPERKLVELTADMRRNWDRYFHEWLNSIRRGPISPSRS